MAVGDDGAYYVSELTGTMAENLDGEASPRGLASIWRVEPGPRNVDCPSENCTKGVTGLNSVIDVEFGPDGYLYVVEFDKDGSYSVVVFEVPGLGTVKKYDVSANSCEIVEMILYCPVPPDLTSEITSGWWKTYLPPSFARYPWISDLVKK